MGVKLVSASGGSVEINPPATASNFVATMPAGTGNVVVNGVNGALVSATAQASTSGTSIDFTGIPSWVKRITVMFSGVSTNGTSPPMVQLGTSSGVTTSGYSSYAGYVANSATTVLTSNTTGFHAGGVGSSSVLNGTVTISLISANTWVSQLLMGNAPGTIIQLGGGNVALSSTLDRVRITTVNGTDTFDAGTINILYE